MTYEMTKINWASEPMPRPVAYCELSEDHLEAKFEAIRRYATQFRPSPHIRSLESVRALASIRGKEVGSSMPRRSPYLEPSSEPKVAISGALSPRRL